MAFNGSNIRTNMVNEGRAFMNDVVDRLDAVVENISKLDRETAKEEYAVRTATAVADSGGILTLKVADIPVGGVFAIDRVTVVFGSDQSEAPSLAVGDNPTDILETAAYRSVLDSTVGSKVFTFRGGYILRGPLPLNVITPTLTQGETVSVRAMIRVLGDPTNS